MAHRRYFSTSAQFDEVKQDDAEKLSQLRQAPDRHRTTVRACARARRAEVSQLCTRSGQRIARDLMLMPRCCFRACIDAWTRIVVA